MYIRTVNLLINKIFKIMLGIILKLSAFSATGYYFNRSCSDLMALCVFNTTCRISSLPTDYLFFLSNTICYYQLLRLLVLIYHLHVHVEMVFI